MTKLRKKAKRRPHSSLHALERQRRIERARKIDREADAELQQGHYGAAERLSRQAAAMRDVLPWA